MKQIKLLLQILAMLMPMMANADAVEIDGIYYNLVSKAKIAEVTKNPDYYSGDVVIPESVTYQGVTYSVTSIGSNAFYNCGRLTSITIPNSVISIGEETFSECTSLTDIYSFIETPFTITDNVFQRNNGLTLHVPLGCKAVYKAAPGWKNLRESQKD